ncbi:TRAP transporter substrate-binding protein DctP [Alkalihalobacillus sp. MEB130]|uniref:TRAP transporter substrate-binding protein DctP n=1 Tax=Alkalihalobacillus sp. MEB130 TaxID=2976704 RepID=UPI0028F0271D|nr:TRAP transporter substrate-binding protein DctP [Alkalihalobacillus sp. MEB130]
MKKLFLVSLFMLSMIMMLAACGSSSSSNSAPESTESENESSTPQETTNEQTVDEVTFDISLSLGEGSFADVGVQKFKEELEALSGGAMSLNLHYNNTFGGEREVIEMMGINSLDMATTSSGALGTWSKEFNMFDLPFLFRDHEHAYQVFDSEIGEELATNFEQSSNVKILSFWTAGYRYLSSAEGPIKHVDDVAGMKHRVQENEVQIDTWRAYGGNPTPMAWPEVYTGLQQGVIESQSNPLDSIYTMKFFEVQDYVSKLPEIYQPYLLLMSETLFDSLTPEQQAIVLEAADNSVQHAREGFEKLDAEATEILKEKGMEITETEDIDVESFKEKVEPVYERFAPEFGEELINSIRNS